MEFDTTQEDKIILRKVSRTQANNSNHPKEFDLIIQGKFNGKKVELGNEAFSYLFICNQTLDIDDISLKIKLELAKDGTPVKIMNSKGLFYRARSVKSIEGSGIDISNVADMSCMFYGCHNLKSLNLSNFNTSNVTDMSYMFRRCSNLSYLDLLLRNSMRKMCGIWSLCSPIAKIYPI